MDGVNIVTKHNKPRSAQVPGGIEKVNGNIDSSNVQVICPACGKATRVAHAEIGGKKTRTCKKCGASLDTKAKAEKKSAKKTAKTAETTAAEATAEEKAVKKTAAKKPAAQENRSDRRKENRCKEDWRRCGKEARSQEDRGEDRRVFRELTEVYNGRKEKSGCKQGCNRFG